MIRLAVLLGLLLTVAGCGGESDGVFDREEFAFTFSYPDEFEETTDVEIAQSLGGAPDHTAAVVLDGDNALIIQSFTLNLAVDESNLGRLKQEFDSLLGEVDRNLSSTESKVAGLPALTIEELEVPTIENGVSRLTAIFDGNQEYYLNCQFTPEHEAEIEEACDGALETFRLK